MARCYPEPLLAPYEAPIAAEAEAIGRLEAELEAAPAASSGRSGPEAPRPGNGARRPALRGSGPQPPQRSPGQTVSIMLA